MEQVELNAKIVALIIEKRRENPNVEKKDLYEFVKSKAPCIYPNSNEELEAMENHIWERVNNYYC